MAKGSEMHDRTKDITDSEVAGMNEKERERYDYIKSGNAFKKFLSYKNLTLSDLIQEK